MVIYSNCFCENRNLDVIKESLHHALGYTITDKYKEFTEQLVATYQQSGTMGIEEHTALAPISHHRVFKNIDGIKFLNHQGVVAELGKMRLP